MSNAATPSPSERELFLQALALPPGERDAFVQRACGSDAPMAARIRELLDAEDGLGAFLETPALAGTAPRTPANRGPSGTEMVETATERAGDRIGRYKLLQNIGEGGCGVVYMAEQEEPVRRRVALKIIKLGMDTKSVIARFEAERQALAMMDHPNIAKFYDAGVTGAESGFPAVAAEVSQGRPYFVMELVRGIRVTDYCDENNLPTTERLDLFMQVCHAIHHAHQKGIIHRDIKPSNILVTLHDGRPVPKVIDFGIAKATEQRLTDKTLFTQFTTFIGTPAYMSPEQAEMSGLDIDTRSDIYSLGVLLYQLLTGKTPFDAEALMRSGLDECRRTIREEEPVRPSTRLAGMLADELTTTALHRRVGSARLIHQLKGDLDWVVMKCLEKDRTRRYASANDLALDVGRYLGSEPVEARPPSNLYRFQKLLHRHRMAFTAAASIAAVLVAGVAVSTWQAIRATSAELQARRAQAAESSLRQQAESEKARAERESGLARLNEYIADINLAQQSVSASGGNLGRALQLLTKHEPGPGEPELRGFEWRYLWQLCQGDEHVALPTQNVPIQSLAFSRSGQTPWLAVGKQLELGIYDLTTRSLITNFPKGAHSLIVTADGDSLISASASTVRVWDTTQWAERRALTNNVGPVSLSADGRLMATFSRDGINVWDTQTWKVVGVIPDAVPPMALRPDGRAVVAAAADRDGLVIRPVSGNGPAVALADSTNLFFRFSNVFRPPRARDEETTQDSGRSFFSRALMPRPGSVFALTFSPDGRYVVAPRNSLSDWGVFIVSIWDAQNGEQKVMPDEPEHPEHTGSIAALAFSPDGRSLATASHDYSIRLWNFETRQRSAILQGHINEVRAVAFSPDGRTIASGARDGTVRLWPTRVAPKEDVIAGKWYPLGFDQHSRTLAALNQDYALVFLNLATGEPEQQFPLEFESGRGGPSRFGFGRPPLVVTPDLRVAAYIAGNGLLRFLNTQTHESTKLTSPDGYIESLLLTADAQTLVTLANRGRTLRVWNLPAGTNVALATEANRIALSPDDRSLIAVTRENLLQIWDLPTRTVRAVIPTDTTSPGESAISPDGRYLALPGQDDIVRIFDLLAGRLLGVCTGHKQRIHSVAFTPDSLTLASVSEDSTLKLWNVATQQELLTIRRLGGAVRELLFSPDGRMLVGSRGLTTRTTGGLRFYRAPALSEIQNANGRRAER